MKEKDYSSIYLFTTLKEHDYLLIHVISHKRPEKVDFLVCVAYDIGLYEIFWSTLCRIFVYGHVRRVLQTETRQIFYRLGLCGRIQNGLTACGQIVDDGVHGLGKAHVKYAVGFV